MSSLGRIVGPGGQPTFGYRSPNGYLTTTVWLNSVGIDVRMHRVVCAAFHGEGPPGALVRHLDGTRTNNRADNLAWGDKKSNALDALLHGVLVRGEDAHNAKLTEGQVREIRRRLEAGGESYSQIGRDYDVTGSNIYAIKVGRSWAWLD